MKRKILLTFALAVLLLCSTALCYAASTTETQCADALYELGLFSGTGTNADGTPIYSLDKTPTRAEAVTMLVRLLGKEDEAKAQEWETPFTDVPTWAEPYVGYAYNNGLTNGTSASTFGSDSVSTETQYLTFVLRALGYSDKDGDFSWDKAKELTDEIGVTSENDKSGTFTRGFVVEVSYNALSAEKKDSDETLIDSLYKDGAVDTKNIPEVKGDESSQNQSTSEEPAKKNQAVESIPYGNSEINSLILSLNPDSMSYSAYDKGYRAFVLWVDKTKYSDVINEFLVHSELFSFVSEEFTKNSNDVTGDATKITITETYDGESYYAVEQLNAEGIIRITNYTSQNINDKTESDSNSSESDVNNTNVVDIQSNAEEIKKYLLSLNPLKSFEAGNKDGTLYHIQFDISMYDTLIQYFNSKQEIFGNIKDETKISGTDVRINICRVEISKLANGSIGYHVEKLFEDGTIISTQYWLTATSEPSTQTVQKDALKDTNIPIGITSINNHLKELLPDSIEEVKTNDYWICWDNNLEIWDELVNYFNSNKNLFAETETYTSGGHIHPVNYTRVVICPSDKTYGNYSCRYLVQKMIKDTGETITMEFHAK